MATSVAHRPRHSWPLTSFLGCRRSLVPCNQYSAAMKISRRRGVSGTADALLHYSKCMLSKTIRDARGRVVVLCHIQNDSVNQIVRAHWPWEPFPSDLLHPLIGRNIVRVEIGVTASLFASLKLVWRHDNQDTVL